MRKKNTYKLIDSFLQLVQQKEISKITVTELCRKADIGRDTFYVCFGNMDRFVTYTIMRTFSTVFSFCLKEGEMFQLLLERIVVHKKIAGLVLLDKTVQYLFGRVVGHFLESSYMEGRDKIKATFYLSGLSGVLVHVINTDEELKPMQTFFDKEQEEEFEETMRLFMQFLDYACEEMVPAE